jgi:hypothetical protein
MFRTLFAVALLGFVQPAHAQLPPVDLGIQNLRQNTGVWCWAAVAQQIILARRGPNATPPQCAMVAIANGADPNICCSGDPRCLVTGSLQQIQGLIAYFGGSYSTIAPPANPMILYNTLRGGRPIIMAVQSAPGAGHVTVLRGMRWDPNYGAILLVNDPMAVFPTEAPFNQIIGAWGAAIVVG